MKLTELIREAKFSSSKVYFHGGYIHPKASVIFFASDFDIAKEHVDMAPTPDGKYVVIEANLVLANPASLSVLKKIIKKSGISEDEMGELLDHDVEDETDYLTSPEIVSMLKEAGHDGVVAKGVFDGEMIDEYIVFSQSQIKIVKKHIVT